jgi:hypothetical protein
MRDELPPFRAIPDPSDALAMSIAPYNPKIHSCTLGKRHRFGGSPEWIQQQEHPKCDRCSCDLTFFAQLDAIGEGYRLGDAGLIYVFFCFRCKHAQSIFQSY